MTVLGFVWIQWVPLTLANHNLQHNQSNEIQTTQLSGIWQLLILLTTCQVYVHEIAEVNMPDSKTKTKLSNKTNKQIKNKCNGPKKTST